MVKKVQCHCDTHQSTLAAQRSPNLIQVATVFALTVILMSEGMLVDCNRICPWLHTIPQKTSFVISFLAIIALAVLSANKFPDAVKTS